MVANSLNEPPDDRRRSGCLSAPKAGDCQKLGPSQAIAGAQGWSRDRDFNVLRLTLSWRRIKSLNNPSLSFDLTAGTIEARTYQ